MHRRTSDIEKEINECFNQNIRYSRESLDHSVDAF